MDAGVRCLLERLRPVLHLRTWDYCVVWKLNQDQRVIEWLGCCCGGAGAEAAVEVADQNTTNTQSANGGEQLVFSVSPVIACRDFMFNHSPTKVCHLLSQLPSSMPLDSAGRHGQTIIENQPRWMFHNDFPHSDEAVGTRLLIPISEGGLVELFVAKAVPQDPHIVEFVIAQCNESWEQEVMNNRSSTDVLGGLALNLKATTNNPWVSPSSTTSDNINLPWDLSLDQNHQLCNPPMNFFGGGFEQEQIENQPKNDMAFQGSTELIMSDRPTSAFNSLEEPGFPEFVGLHHQSLMMNTSNSNNIYPSMETHSSCVTKEPGHDKDSVKQETGRADSVSDCSDQMEDDDDQKVVGRTGRRHQSKNLVAERRRRKKLNDRLYTLRSLVPKITKMDRASILGDAIEFVKELQKQVKDLQDELEEPPLEEDGDKNACNDNINNNTELDMSNQNEYDESLKGIIEQGTRCSSNGKMTQFPKKQTQDFVIAEDKTPQMEVQVEVTQIDGNEFFLKVFCEHKPGGFVRLMEAMNSLGLEVTNANVTTCRDLVLNVFRVEKRDNETVQAEYVRDSLLELTRNPMGAWSGPMVQAPENGNALDFHHHHHTHHHHRHHLHSLNLQA